MLVTGPELEQAVESHEQAEELHLRESIRFPRGLQVSSDLIIVNLFFCQARETGVWIMTDRFLFFSHEFKVPNG